MMNRKGLENFWYYNKVKVIVGVIVIALLVTYMQFTKGDIKSDVEIAYVTDGRTIPVEKEGYLKKVFAARIEDVTGDKYKETAFIPLMGPRIDLEFVGGSSQIVLVDGDTLGRYVKMGAFEPLDTFVNKFKVELKDNPEVTANINGNEAHAYAIPVKSIPLFLNAGFPADNYYMVLRGVIGDKKIAKDKNRNAHAIIETILSYP